MVRLRTSHAQISAALELFRSLPDIVLIYRLTGEDCFLLDVRTRDASGWRRWSTASPGSGR